MKSKKGVTGIVQRNLFLDKMVQSAIHDIRVITNLERTIVSKNLSISRTIARKLFRMLDDELQRFVQLPIVNEHDETIDGWTFLHAAVHSSIEVKPRPSLKFQESYLRVNLFNNEDYFLRTEEIFARLNKAWAGYAKIEYQSRAGNVMVVKFKLIP